ncbi:probable inactive receptor-like protein kinase At3g56050 [Papaver somniferum]|uniref:probable inactive receptor-like protein kinase At3g56050 n=1 Tax=Papaver somniferum TaxID=3469 RepID=UPI000E702092|nr:probable inactive receptor-like protein kinase At3g56050 [Papaver somniferum]
MGVKLQRNLGMEELWRWRWRRLICIGLLVLGSCVDSCLSLNDEGISLLRFRERVGRDPYGVLLNWKFSDGAENPCSWFGVKCSTDDKVISLDLKDLSLEGTLAPEIRNLVYMKSIILRNNSFSGIIPLGIGELKELKVLDLGFNNFDGPLPSNLGDSLSLVILLVDNNKNLGRIEKSQLSSLWQVSHSIRRAITWSIAQVGEVARRSLLRAVNAPRSLEIDALKSISGKQTHSSVSPALSPFSQPPTPSPAPAHVRPFFPPIDHSAFLAAPPPIVPNIHSTSAFPSPPERTGAHSKKYLPIVSVAIGASFLSIAAIVVLLCRSKKVVSVKPWVTGLSGQLQKAFVTGVPKLKRSELETACEDFSNIIGSSSDGTMYKGTLSSGVEIAVTSTAVTSSKEWSKHHEGQFRKKIDVLSKVNHKNFVNLLGFCEEEEPFTRMMVFEYAPNGTLFEHLHIKEAEHLDWGVRLRIAMGIAYCLEYMHQLSPPVIVKNLQSTSIYLTEDYAAKISDLGFWSEATAVKMGSSDTENPLTPSVDTESNIYSFGIILLEMINGGLPCCVNDVQLVEWASDYLRKTRPVKDMVDSTLKYFHEENLEKLCEVIRSCINPDRKERPTIKDVTAQLREITAMTPDGATPKLSPLWWAELEIISTEAT